MIHVCSCGFATDDDDWLECHLIERPEHRAMESYGALDLEPQR